MFSFECLREFLLSIHVERSLNYVYNSIIYEGYVQVEQPLQTLHQNIISELSSLIL